MLDYMFLYGMKENFAQISCSMQYLGLKDCEANTYFTCLAILYQITFQLNFSEIESGLVIVYDLQLVEDTIEENMYNYHSWLSPSRIIWFHIDASTFSFFLLL